MEHDRPRWRFRMSTLMLLVVILALVLTLVSDRWNSWTQRERARVQRERARVERQKAFQQGLEEQEAEARANALRQKPPGR
jgi:type II secretory pathway pseudopilin PulG